MSDLSNYFTFPGTGNWGSGSTTTEGNTSTTQKYFDPAAILAMQKYYGTQLGGYSALNNSILYGKNAPKTGTTPPGAAAPPPGHVAPAAPPSGTIPPPGTNPPAPKPTPPVTVAPPEEPTPAPTPTEVYSHGEVPQASARSTSMAGVDGEPSAPGPGTFRPPTGTTPPSTDPSRPTHGVVQGSPGGTPRPHTTPGDMVATENPEGPVPIPRPRDPGNGVVPGPDPGRRPLGPATPPPDSSGGDTPGGSGAGLLGALQQLLEGGGYSDAEKQAITEKAAGALAAQKGSAQSQLAGQLARSGNAAGYGGAMSSLDNSAAQTASDQARQNEIDFSNEGERRKELAAAGLTSLLGINTAAQLGTSGQASGLASLGGGVDTATRGGSSFENKNFQATPDASTKPPSTGTGNPPAGSKEQTLPNGNKVYPDPKGTGTYYDPYGNVVDPKTGWPVNERGEPIVGAQYDVHGNLFDKDGNVLDPLTGWPVDEYGNPVNPNEPGPGEAPDPPNSGPYDGPPLEEPPPEPTDPVTGGYDPTGGDPTDPGDGGGSDYIAVLRKLGLM